MDDKRWTNQRPRFFGGRWNVLKTYSNEAKETKNREKKIPGNGEKITRENAKTGQRQFWTTTIQRTPLQGCVPRRRAKSVSSMRDVLWALKRSIERWTALLCVCFGTCVCMAKWWSENIAFVKFWGRCWSAWGPPQQQFWAGLSSFEVPFSVFRSKSEVCDGIGEFWAFSLHRDRY